MIPLIIFYLHIVGITIAFTAEYQKEDLSAGLLSVGFVVLIFSVGWSISSFVLKYLIGEAGFGMWMNRDSLSLLLLTIAEGLFYFLYFKESDAAPAK
ncbi:MAG: hypothetical protein ACOYNS_08600 [Bacteroidota bacterium]